MVLTKNTTTSATGYPGNDLKQFIQGAGTNKTIPTIQSSVSSSGTPGLNSWSWFSKIELNNLF
jgi:hypothetical protein